MLGTDGRTNLEGTRSSCHSYLQTFSPHYFLQPWVHTFCHWTWKKSSETYPQSCLSSNLTQQNSRWNRYSCHSKFSEALQSDLESKLWLKIPTVRGIDGRSQFLLSLDLDLWSAVPQLLVDPELSIYREHSGRLSLIQRLSKASWWKSDWRIFALWAPKK